MNGRWAFAALAALILVYLGPLVLFGEVIYPHDNRLEVGLTQSEPAPTDAFPQSTWNPVAAFARAPIDNRKFSDHSSVYVPELHQHLRGDGRAWISTWNPHVELGRPTMQLSGLSRAFVLTRVLAWFGDDAFALYTRLFSLTVVLTALFTYLFLRSLELDPWAATFAATGLATGVFTSFWATFVMYLSTVCWTMALLWLVTIFVRRATVARGLGIAFAIHALLLAGYPQEIVWHGYLLVAYTLLALARELRARRAQGGDPHAARAIALRALVLGASVIAGVVSVLPVYVDVAIDAARTARSENGPEFFFSRLPNLNDLRDVCAYVVRLFDALWFGNPVDPRYAKFDGVSWTPLFAGLLAVSWMEGLAKKNTLWLAFIAVAAVMTVSPSLYLFGIDHLGLSLSRFVPMAATVIPMAVVGAIVLDHALRTGFARPWRAALVSLVPCAVALAATTRTYFPLHGGFIVTGVALSLACAALFVFRRIGLLVAILAVSVLHYGQRLVLARPEDEIALRSRLTERIAAETRDGSRYTTVGGFEGDLLPPNQEVRLGLASIHSFNPLLPLAYARWILRLSEAGARLYGKQIHGIKTTSKIHDDEFTYSGVSVLVSPKPLDDRTLEHAAEELGVQLYRTHETPALYAQLATFEVADAMNTLLDGPLSAHKALPATRTDAKDDWQRFETTRSDRPTLLWLSQQFHPSWVARSRGEPLRTTTVNEFYLGVVLPPGTDEVELEFRPWVLWSGVPQWSFALGALACAVVGVSRGRSRTKRARHST